MQKIIKQLTIFLVLIEIAIFYPQKGFARSASILGDTPEEISINQLIVQSTDEQGVFDYLTSTYVSVRITASMRLGVIGTSYSLSGLLDLAINDTDDKVKEEAAFSVWKIRYEEDIASGGGGKSILLSIFITDGDITKIVRAKAWAMQILGDMGAQDAILVMQAIINDTTYTPYLVYLQEIAQENITKINFINSFPPETEPLIIVEEGLARTELYIRKWALNKLVKLNPTDLIERLNTLLQQALQNDENQFAIYIAQALETEKEKNRYPPLEIIYPQDGVTLKTPRVEIFGYTYGEPFHELFNLNQGANVYTKTITDRDNNSVSKSITIYLQNQPPVLNPIGNKEVIVGKPLNFTISARDPDDTNLLYFVYPYPLAEGMSFNYNTHTFTFIATKIGTYTVKFEVDDGYGMTDEETITIEVTGPQLEVIDPTPQGQQAVTGIVTVSVQGQDLDDFCYVYLYCDKNYIAYDYKKPYQYKWNTTYFTNGIHTLKAGGYHSKLMKWIESEPIQVEVYNKKPQVPSITITNLTKGQTITGEVSVKAAVSHPSKMRYVVFYLDGQYISFDYTQPFEIRLPAQYFTNGQHTIKVTSYFNGPPSILCEYSATVNIYNEGGPTTPTVSIDNLAENQEVKGDFIIRVSASDKYMYYLYCYVDDKYLAYDSTSPYQFSWPTKYYEDGLHAVKVRGYHSITHQWYETTVTADVRNSIQPLIPKVSINLVDGQNVTGDVTINVVVNDPTYMKYTYLYVDNQFVDYDWMLPLSFKWNSRYWSNGTHMIKVTTYHYLLRQWYETQIRVNVKNAQTIIPTITINSHTNNQKVSGTQKIGISSNDLSKLVYMYLYVDDRYAGYKYGAPFTISCDTTRYLNGAHKFKIRCCHMVLRKHIESDEITLNFEN